MKKLNDSETSLSTLASAMTLNASFTTSVSAHSPKTVRLVEVPGAKVRASLNDHSNNGAPLPTSSLIDQAKALIQANRIQEAETVANLALSKDKRKWKTSKAVEIIDNIAVDETILGHLCVRGGRFEEAEKHYRHALEIHEATDSPCLIIGLCNLANLLEYDGRHDEADLLREEAVIMQILTAKSDDEDDGEFIDEDEDFDDGYGRYIPAWCDTLGRQQYEAFLAAGSKPTSGVGTAPQGFVHGATAYAA